ncbi:N-myristoyltransferase (nucleomorph) [Chroomonas mesostigmatica CCMP1168]|uniref:Glycylpeptide N-tetradecanoyltransferase n=1 Tax=Chroomonas mesostigmatica CCMP1168 TaxID=1195612 RepID=J7G5D3_9CRYP|nr:N-myristoyltransferase [Chroomonas mesostigmatica CCMP1168]|mmetsp:Transcript_25621/g.63130  ORF Transcript_25621/g.63130 Transcript_25621/m.63130 type:complete len:354 (-) Transcript_25621:335-1396(-)
MRKQEICLRNISIRPFFFPFEVCFSDLDLKNVKRVHLFFRFLEKNYIEDNDCYFRFNYIHEFLTFALMVPGWSSIFNLEMKFVRSKKILGSITSFPKLIIYNNYFIYSAEINFLCFLKKIRNKRCVSSFIGEITRRLNLNGISQAMFTTAICFSKSFLTRRFYHYSINPQKLFNLEFTPILNFIPNIKLIFGKFEKCVYYDLKTIKWYISTRKHLLKFAIYNYFDVKNFFHFFRTIPGVLYTFPLKKNKKKNLKVISFFSIPEKIIAKTKKKFIFSSYWYFSFFKISLKLSYQKLIENTLKLGFDLFNIVESFSDKKNLFRWNFKKGTGRLQFHIFNWKNYKIPAKNNSLTFF